jgi:molybdopterin-biosynthesis enzyme MoeA-like protein
MTNHHLSSQQEFGLIVIGDEILFGRREDRHLQQFRAILGDRGLRLAYCYYLPDEPSSLIHHLRLSLGESRPVFVCGGIGATPDDRTRACAAEAAGVELVRHPQAAALIEARFGQAAYPTRIQMADLPANCELIPNPYNRVPGFSVNIHYFLPGFPEMAWPMARWVLDQIYAYPKLPPIGERALKILNTPESRLVPIMQKLSAGFPGLKLFSLPHLGEEPYLELGFRGQGDLERAISSLQSLLEKEGVSFEEPSPRHL